MRRRHRRVRASKTYREIARIRELSMIKNIERLNSELKRKPFRQFGFFHEGHINLPDVWRANQAIGLVSITNQNAGRGVNGWRGKRVGGDDLESVRSRRSDCQGHAGNHIRSLGWP